MSDVILGNKIKEGEIANRDAIHIAIAPAIAGQNLKAGQHVGFVGNDTETFGTCEKPIGIVDPFLKGSLKVGEKFWVCLYPKTITSLRHDWIHADFTRQEKSIVPPVPAKSDSQVWMEDYADELGLQYNDLIQGATNYVRYGEYLVRGGLLEGVSLNEEFWDHYEIVTGTVVDSDRRGHFFSCSC